MYARRLRSAVVLVAAIAASARAEQPQTPMRSPPALAAAASPYALAPIPFDTTNSVPTTPQPLPSEKGSYAPCLPETPCEFGCGPVGRIWVGAEYLWWAGKGDRLPPLVSSSPAGTPRDQAGVLGTPGATTLFGDEFFNNDLRSGGRFTLGLWLDDCRTWGLEASTFFMSPTGDQATFASSGSPIIARPFFNALTGLPDAQIIAFPGVSAGSAHAAVDNTVWGGAIDALCNLCCGCKVRVDARVGYAFLRLTDTVTVLEDLTATGSSTGVPAGTRFQIADRFRTWNAFDGLKIGLSGEFWAGRAFLAWNTSIAFGEVRETVDIGGATRTSGPGQVTTLQTGGLLALASNSSSSRLDEFAVLPAAGLRVGMQVTSSLRVSIGYDFLYLSRVTRPGDVIDPTVNPAQLPPATPGGPARPALLASHSDYWLQGLSGGVELRY
jgi:Putative beta barrel porin-7 (BBP7)